MNDDDDDDDLCNEMVTWEINNFPKNWNLNKTQVKIFPNFMSM